MKKDGLSEDKLTAMETELVVTDRDNAVDANRENGKTDAFFDVDRDVVIAKIVLEGDLSRLSPREKVAYYNALCNAYSLNPASRPFEYLTLKGKDVLYATKSASEQLRKKDGVSVTRMETGRDPDDEDLYFVRVYGKNAHGREDVGTGYLSIAGLKGEALGNAKMKCETKAKRRMTLSICGLGMLDESEIDTIGEQYIERDTPELKQEYRVKIYQALEDNEAILHPATVADARYQLDVAETVGDFRRILDYVNDNARKLRQQEARIETKENWKNAKMPEPTDVSTDPTDEEFAAEIAAHDEQKDLF